MVYTTKVIKGYIPYQGRNLKLLHLLCRLIRAHRRPERYPWEALTFALQLRTAAYNWSTDSIGLSCITASASISSPTPPRFFS